jgi:AraC-like DNA-binding protein
MQPAARADSGIKLFVPPYHRFEGIDGVPREGTVPRGAAVVWWLADAERQAVEFDRLRDRPFDLPLVVLLPPPRDIARTMPLLNLLMLLKPKSVLPGMSLGSPEAVRHVLATPPPSLSEAVVRQLVERGLVPDRTIARELRRIFELATDCRSISRLARRMYTSRRTLGRHFAAAGLPVPSHWLQFARLLHVSIHLQNEPSAIFRIAARTGYPDGFTLSNQMKRLIGCRPTEVRACLGWEWILEAWLEREWVSGGLRMRAKGRKV